MTREDAVLAVLAAAKGKSLSPVQFQKALFLLDRNLPEGVLSEKFGFTPYDYGPFDASVYRIGESLADRGLASIQMAENARWKYYAATPEGIVDGNSRIANLPENVRKYMEEVVEWVTSLSFGSLVKSIYTAYPEMKENSIFVG
jgi:uncharacterized protein